MRHRFDEEFLRAFQLSLRADEPRWHGIVRTVYKVLFVVIWLEAMGCFVYFQTLARSGSPVPTPELAASIVNHGHAFYVAVQQKQLYELLLTTMKFGIPGIMLTGFLLYHLVHVKIFDNR